MSADFREIVEQNQFKEDKKKLKHSAKRLDEILDGVIWALARLADGFPQIPGTIVYLAKTDSVPGVTSLYIWFTLDDDHVYLEGIEEAPQSE